MGLASAGMVSGALGEAAGERFSGAPSVSFFRS